MRPTWLLYYRRMFWKHWIWNNDVLEDIKLPETRPAVWIVLSKKEEGSKRLFMGYEKLNAIEVSLYCLNSRAEECIHSPEEATLFLIPDADRGLKIIDITVEYNDKPAIITRSDRSDCLKFPSH